MKVMKAVKKSERGPPFKAEKERKPRASGRHAKRSRLRLPKDSRQRPYRVEWEGFDAWGGQAPTTADGRVIELTPGVRQHAGKEERKLAKMKQNATERCTEKTSWPEKKQPISQEEKHAIAECLARKEEEQRIKTRTEERAKTMEKHLQ